MKLMIIIMMILDDGRKFLVVERENILTDNRMSFEGDISYDDDTGHH